MFIGLFTAAFRLPGRFHLLWLTTGVSNLADGFVKLLLPLLAMQVTHEPILVSGVAVALSLPWLLFSLLGGVLVDRWDRHRIMQWANGVRAGTLAGLAGLLLVDSLPLFALYGAAFVLGIAEICADTAAGAFLPSLVAPEELERANVRLAGVQTVTNQFVGPPVGGALASLGLAFALNVSSILYLIAVLALLFVTGSFRPATTSTQTLWADMAEGIQFIWRQRLLRTLTVLIAAMNFCWSAFYALLVLYVVAPGPGGLTPFWYGVLLMSVGVGGLAGTLLLEQGQRYLGRRWLIAGDIIGTLLLLLVSAMTAKPWLIGTVAAFAGMSGAMSNVTVVSLRQRIVPDQLLGRVGGASRMVSYGALALGAAIAGIVAQVWEIRTVFSSSAVLAALLLLFFLRQVTPAEMRIIES